MKYGGKVDQDQKGGFRKLIGLMDAVDTIVWCSILSRPGILEIISIDLIFLSLNE